MKPLTRANVYNYSRFLEDHYGVTIIDADHWFVNVIRFLLELWGKAAISKGVDRWLRRYSISMKRFVKLRFVVGCRNVSCIEQLLEIDHEFSHVHEQQEWERGKDPRYRKLWTTNYCTNTAFRTKSECLAYRTEMEIAEMLGYRVDPDACVARLVAGYAVKPIDKRVATTLLRKYAKYVEKGKISQPVSKLFRDWWEI